MALFKILRGDSSRISTDITPFHDGYAYFTSDDGGFYIDSEQDGVQKRHRINPDTGGTAISATLLSSAWENGRQIIPVDGTRIDSNGMISLSQTASDAEIAAAKAAKLYIAEQGTDELTVAASGEPPARDIPVVIILFG